MSNVLQQYASFQDSLRREQWTRSLSAQVAAWKSRATEALGLSASVE